MFVNKNTWLHKWISKAERPVLYLAVFFHILEGPTVYHSMTQQPGFFIMPGRLIDWLTMAATALLLIMAVLKYEVTITTIKRGAVMLAAYYVAVILWFVFSLSDQTYVFAFIYYFIVILPMLIVYFCFVVSGKEGNSLFYAFSDIMCVIAAVSLVFWLLASVIGVVTTTERIIADWGEVYEYPSYMGIYFERQTANVFGLTVQRNQGIFAEAPMYDAYLVTALCVEAYMRPWKKFTAMYGESPQETRSASVPRLVLLLLTVVTTLTSSGLVFAAVIACSIFFLYPMNGKYARRVKIALGAILAFAAAAVVIVVIAEKSGSSSFRIRVDDFYACFRAWSGSPVFGIGCGNTQGIINYMSDFRSDNLGLATGAGTVLAQGGLIATAVYVVPLVTWVVKCVRRRNWSMLCFAAVAAVLLVTAVINYTVMMFMMLAPAYSALCVKDNSAYAVPEKKPCKRIKERVHVGNR